MAKVSFILNPNDFRAALLGSMGFSNDYIQRQTGLTPCQISYRLRRAGIRLTDYRSGTNSTAKQVMIATKDTIGDRLKNDLRKVEAAIERTIKKTKKTSQRRRVA